MNTLDELIEVLQGVKAGRKWGVRFKSSGDLCEQCSQSIETLSSLVGANDVERIELMPKTKTCNGVEISAPLRVAPKIGEIYWVASPGAKGYCIHFMWSNVKDDKKRLERGLIHATTEAAAAHGRAMCGAPT